ncbi:MAG: S8 family serine peptidase [Clostridia bacterium]|nr:S8 family serine peptidase [Clostridia bacterium]
MKIISSIILTLTLFLSLIIYPVSASDDYWSKKINDEIKKADTNNNNEKLIIVFREKVSDDEIEATFEKRHGYSIQKYENEAIYKMTVVPEVTERVNAKYGKVYADNAEMGQKAFDDNTTFLKQELLNDYNQFVYNKRHIISDLYTSEIDSFKSRNNINDDLILYEGIYTGSIIMYANDSEIKELAKDSSVIEISIWENDLIEDDEETYHQIIGTDDVEGTKSEHYNNGTGYKGTDVKIGIIEVNGGKYQTEAKQLKDIPNSRLQHIGLFKSNPEDPTLANEREHATLVTSIIVGQSYELYTIEREGIVPNATVFQASIGNSPDDLLDAIQTLVDTYNVSVINYSAGLREKNEDGEPVETLNYLDSEKEIDAICYTTNVTFVKSAGNQTDHHPYYDVSLPGKAYNIITVGNVDTVTPPSSGRYSMHSSSCYKEAPHLSNKPDLVAPGTLIGCVDANNELIIGTGTSSSAPMVTGVVAQLHQASPTLISNPTKTKALILAGADPTVISPEYNSGVNPNGFIREKSGLGMLNAVNSVNAALEGNFGSTTFNLRGTNTNMHTYSGDAVQVGKQYLRAGEKIRVVLTFDKPEHLLLVDENYNNNVDLYLYGPNGNMVSSSVTPVDSTGAPDVANNVEVLEFTATTAGEYKIKAKLVTFNGAPGTTTMNVAAAWTTTHNHIYNVSYEQRPSYPAHYAYCICGKSIEENHTFISGPVGTYCSKCYYISSYN